MQRLKKIKIFLFALLIQPFVFVNYPVFSQHADSLYQQALVSSDSTEKITLLKQALAAEPNLLKVHLELGKIYFHRHQEYEAQHHFLTALGIDRQNATAYAYLGELYRHQQKNQQAITFFQQALKWQPTNSIALEGLKKIRNSDTNANKITPIKTAISQANWERAFTLFQQLEEKNLADKSLAEIRQKIAQHFYEKAGQQAQINNRTQALILYQKVQSIFPDYLDVAMKIERLTNTFSTEHQLPFQPRVSQSSLDTTVVLIQSEPIPKDTIETVLQPPETLDLASGQQLARQDSLDQEQKSLRQVVTEYYQRLLQTWKRYLIWLLIILILFFLVLIFSLHRRNKRIQRRLHPPAPSDSRQPRTKSEPIGLQPSEHELSETEPEEYLETQPRSTDTIRRFRLQQLVGQFLNVQLYIALDRRLHRKVLIDRISWNSNDDQARASQRKLIQGVQKAANLFHPQIVKIEDVFLQDQLVYVVLEYFPFISLEKKLSTKKPLELLPAMRIMQQLCTALAYAHQQRIIHGHVQPLHIQLLENGSVKLGGFELIQLDHQMELSSSGTSTISPSYMSPEQIRNNQVDLRTDIFSAGIVFYEMVTGVKPFLGQFAASIIYHILEGSPIQPKEINNQIPNDLNQMIMKMLAKKPNDRYFNAQDIALELKKFL